MHPVSMAVCGGFDKRDFFPVVYPPPRMESKFACANPAMNGAQSRTNSLTLLLSSAFGFFVFFLVE